MGKGEQGKKLTATANTCRHVNRKHSPAIHCSTVYMVNSSVFAERHAFCNGNYIFP